MSNQVTLVGRISSQYTYDHEIYREKYYRFTLIVTRDSGTKDFIPVIVSERLINDCQINDYVAVKGQFRSFKSDGKLLLFVFATDIELTDPADVNDVFLEGTLVKDPVHRFTPYGREITDILLRVPRAYNKVDFIPCVVWGRSAKYVSLLTAGSGVRVAGRVQSRDYLKGNETKTAYELSVNLVESV